jgi:hypothetical protein
VIHNSAGLDSAILGCSEAVDSLAPLIEQILPKKSESKTARLRKAFKSLKYESLITKTWAEIESYKTTLILHFVQRAPMNAIETTPAPRTYYLYPRRLVGHYVDRQYREILQNWQQLKSIESSCASWYGWRG